MKRVVPFLLLTTLLGSPFASRAEEASPRPSDAASGWEKIGHDDGISAFKKEVPGSPIVAFRGEGVIDAPLDRVAAVLFDENRATEWVDSLKDGHVVRRNGPRDYVIYSHIGTPPLMSDRDFVTHCHITVDERTHTVIQHLKATTDPAAPETKYVRGELIDSSFTLKSLPGGKGTFIIAEIHADPKGSVAKWIVNRFQRKWPHNTIEAIRKQVKKPDVQPDPSYSGAVAR